MDAIRTGTLASFCSSILGMQKKMLKQSGMSKTSAADAADDVFLSSEAARAQEAMGVDQANNAPATPQERFLASAMEELSQLDPNSETFFYDSTSTLVNLALRESFGDRIFSSLYSCDLNWKAGTIS